MKTYDIEINKEVIKFRLPSCETIELEKKTKCRLLDYVQDYSLTNVITLIKYMRRFEVPNFSEQDASELYDKLIDNGYTLEKVIFDLIYEVLVLAGFLTKEELKEIKQSVKDKK